MSIQNELLDSVLAKLPDDLKETLDNDVFKNTLLHIHNMMSILECGETSTTSDELIAKMKGELEGNDALMVRKIGTVYVPVKASDLFKVVEVDNSKIVVWN
jgi:hypothetical protein